MPSPSFSPSRQLSKGATDTAQRAQLVSCSGANTPRSFLQQSPSLYLSISRLLRISPCRQMPWRSRASGRQAPCCGVIARACVRACVCVRASACGEVENVREFGAVGHLVDQLLAVGCVRASVCVCACVWRSRKRKRQKGGRWAGK